MPISENALRVLESRYLLRSAEGEIMESPDELFRRVAHHMAKAELVYGNVSNMTQWEDQFFNIMIDHKFLPNSPTLMNAGIGSGQLSACFVLPVKDSLEGIFTTLKHTALIQQSGGGTGFNFSSLRPNGDFISTNSGSSSGPVSFMKIFDVATENIKQGGKRRGANMGILNIDHPDILEFIKVKQEEGVLKNFNISVAISDDFMSVLTNDGDWELKHPRTRKTVNKVKAKLIWEAITYNAWLQGDPGLVFLDTINATNPTPQVGRMDCTNPCGEVPLLPYEACNLGSIDVSKFIHTTRKEIHWEELGKVIQVAVRFLDNVIEMNDYLIPKIKNTVMANRKIGLGIMGWANLLIALEVPYASDEAIVLAETLMKFIQDKSFAASQNLAQERGVFRNWEKSIYFPDNALRNATRTSIAPTGTISVIANTSSSIEPLFALAMRRENVLNQETLSEINPLFVDHLKRNGLYSDELMNLVKTEGSIAHSHLPEKEKELFRTAMEIEPIWHLKHQLAFQKYTDNAVSKTINLPHKATVKDISDIYLYAWQHKAKGITVYRYGSKNSQVLYSGVNDESGNCKICRT